MKPLLSSFNSFVVILFVQSYNNFIHFKNFVCKRPDDVTLVMCV